ncbi:hypothetical protein ACXR0O_01250 [Verrucomicrobiota bacterium sgz303538]
MQTTSSHTSVAPEEITKVPETNDATKAHPTALENFYRFLVIAFGIILAGITALIIGLFTGWIPITC